MSLMNDYIIDKKYNTSYCDAVPLITANSLSLLICIIYKDNGQYRNHVVKPRYYSSSCKHVYILKSGDHYDALIPNESQNHIDSLIMNCINEPDDVYDVNSQVVSQSGDHYHVLQNYRNKHSHNLITCHLNVNALNNKFQDISPLLTDHMVDILFLSETKLDDSYKSATFHVKGFSKPIRSDRNINGGGLMLIIRNYIACCRLKDIESLVISPIECLIVEIIVKKEMCAFVCLYNPHKRHKIFVAIQLILS